MTLPISHCQGQAGFDCLHSEASKLKSANASLSTRRKRPAKQPQRQRLAVFRITAAATAAQTQADSTQSQTSSQAPQQKAPWQSVASGLVSSLQRHRRENHLPLCRAFGVESLAHLRDVFNCMCLSEGVYKVVDYGEEKATQILGAILEGFPPGLVSLKRVEWSRPDSNHRCLLGEADGALYMAFMGTKQRRDLVTNAQVLQEPIWPEDLMSEPQEASQAVPAAHRGFLLRARDIPIEAMYEQACRQKRRLVLSGHSLGGAVAVLCTLRLLRQLPPDAQPAVQCHVFACPAIGNAALAMYVKQRGWERYFSNMLIPEDAVPRILGGMQEGVTQSLASSSYLDGRSVQGMPGPDQAPSKRQWRPQRLLRLPGRSLVRVSLPRSRPSPEQPGSSPRAASPKVPQLGARDADSTAAPSDASSELFNWEKQLGSWEENSPGSSAADLSAERAAELEAHARELAAEVSQQGSEWEPLTASMDDGGQGMDLVAGMGSDASSDIASSGSMEDPADPSDDGSRSTGTEAHSLAPTWPLSLYPLSYRQDYRTEPAQQTGSMPSDVQNPSAALPYASSGQRQNLSSTPASSGGDELKAANILLDGGSTESSRPAGGSRTELSIGVSRSWQEESLPSSVSDDYLDDRQEFQAAEQGLGSLAGSRASQPSAAEKAVELALSSVASPQRPREPIRRLQSMRQTAAKAGNAVLGVGKFSAKMGVGLASFSMKRAASFASVPFRVPIRAAQRQYFPIGRQLFLYPDIVTMSAPELGSNGSQRQMFEDPAAWCADRAPGQPSPEDALPLDVRQLQNSALPLQERIALLAGATPPQAGQRPQPFVMHKMAFHRGRALGIIRRTLHNSLPANADAQAEFGGAVKDGIFDDVLALKQPSAMWPRPSPVGAPNARGNILRQHRLKESLLGKGIAPVLKARSAETWVEWALPGKEDVEQILDDLGSLSDPGRMAQTGSERWRWLQPWTWILGVWGTARRQADFVLDVTVRGRGLETCSGVQVQALGNVPCRAAIMQKPTPRPPGQVTALLHPGVPDALRTAALLGAWVSDGVRWTVGAVDRQNATGTQDDLKVRVWVPAAVMRRAQAMMVQGTGPGSSGLMLKLTSSFYESSVPLQIHAGGSALVSDVQAGARAFLEWMAKNLDGGLS